MYILCRRFVFCRKVVMIISSTAVAVLTSSCHSLPKPMLGPRASHAMIPPAKQNVLMFARFSVTFARFSVITIVCLLSWCQGCWERVVMCGVVKAHKKERHCLAK